MKIKKLLGSKVMIRSDEPEEKVGLIIVPDTGKKPSELGTVVAVGSGYKMTDGSVRPLDVKEGDRVLFSKWGEEEVQNMDKDLVLVKEVDVYAVFEEN